MVFLENGAFKIAAALLYYINFNFKIQLSHYRSNGSS